MALTPMDIYNKEFSKGFRGYDEEEVDMFLDQVVDEYEKLQKASAAAEEKIQTLTERLDHYRSLEGTLKDTLVTAQNTAEEVVDNARKKAALIIDSAQREARDIIERAGSQIEQVEKMDLELRKAAAVFKSRFVALLETQLEFFRQETADINVPRNTMQTDTASQAQTQPAADREPVEPVVHEEEPAPAATVGVESAVPQQEIEEPVFPQPEPEESAFLEEREEPLTPEQSQAESIDPMQEWTQPQTPAPPVSVYEEQPEPLAEVEPIQDERPEPLEPVNAEPVQADTTDYFGTSQPPSAPPDETEEEIDDADALIREIQHYSALRNDEDTVSDEGFIIGRDD